MTADALALDETKQPTLSVAGGTGRYLAALGSVTATAFGANITRAPNFTTDFRLVNHDR